MLKVMMASSEREEEDATLPLWIILSLNPANPPSQRTSLGRVGHQVVS